MSLSQTKEERELFGGEHHKQCLGKKDQERRTGRVSYGLGKGVIGGITEGCSPGWQTWKLCEREVKTRNRQVSEKTGWKGKKRNGAEARGRSRDGSGFFKMGRIVHINRMGDTGRREEDGWSKVLEEGGRKGPNAEVEGLASDTRRDSLFTEIGGKEERMGPDR